jgi:hypothetical protein
MRAAQAEPHRGIAGCPIEADRVVRRIGGASRVGEEEEQGEELRG